MKRIAIESPTLGLVVEEVSDTEYEQIMQGQGWPKNDPFDKATTSLMAFEELCRIEIERGIFPDDPLPDN